MHCAVGPNRVVGRGRYTGHIAGGRVRSLTIFLSITAEGRWRPSLGDPSVVGFITVFAYLCAALLAVQAAFSARRRLLASSGPAQAQVLFRFWLAIAALLLLLGVNKQLDFQTLLIQWLRDLALAQGWYEKRRVYQVAFILAIFAAIVSGCALLLFSLRRVVRHVWLGIVGIGLLAGFVLIRAASFHHVDLWLKQGAVPLNGALELFCIAVLALGALRERGQGRAHPRGAG